MTLLHNPKNLHKCKMCLQTFVNEFQLACHFTNQHFHCETCSITFERRRETIEHMDEVHQIQVTQTIRPELTKKVEVDCPICGEKFNRFLKLKNHHRLVHDTSKALPCSTCGKLFPRSYELNRHIKHVHEKTKQFNCKLCEKTFPQQQNLDKHISGVHQKLKPFQCDICQNFFAQTSSLYLHKKNVHKIGGKMKLKSSSSEMDDAD